MTWSKHDIYRLRQHCAMTVIDFAKALKVARMTVYRWERGEFKANRSEPVQELEFLADDIQTGIYLSFNK